MTTRPGTAGDLLDAIVGSTRRTVEARAERTPAAALERLCDGRAPKGDVFRARLTGGSGVRVIAECKRRSPSRGVLRAAYEPARVASAYEAAGAVAVSVLTEPAFFDGALEHLAEVRRAVALPVLRKDFIVEPYQLLEAVAYGADAVLLIAAALEPRVLAALVAQATRLGLASLVEVHDNVELTRAIDAGAGIVGVNTRNLRTLEVSVAVAHELAERIPEGLVAVAESGLRDPAAVVSLASAGYDAFLVGEHFMTAPEPGAALAELVAACAGRLSMESRAIGGGHP